MLFVILKRPYGPRERHYLTAKVLGLSQGQWEQLPWEQRVALAARELWRPQKFEEYCREIIREHNQARRKYR